MKIITITAALILAALLPLKATTLLKTDFDTGPLWTAQSGYFTSAAGAITATATVDSVSGTIDTAGTSTGSAGLKLAVNSSAATGTWTAGLDSGVLSLLAANTRAAGFLTLSFSLSASSAYPVRVKIESYNSGNVRTGGLATLIFPAAPDFYQRYAIDLDKMTADGSGTFNPADPKVRIFFELDSTANGNGWPIGAAHSLKIDNVNYSTPKYYVKPSSIGGSNSKSGLDEANALSSVQAAINKTLSGDNIIAIMEDTVPGGDDYAPDTNNYEMVGITKAGTPDSWIVCKNYPGHAPALKSNGWQAFKIHSTAAYVEVRGLIIRGQSYVDANGDRQINPLYAADIAKVRSPSNGSGISINSPAHHVRVADNVLEYLAGSSGGSADRLTIENNISRYNCWWMIYAGSGLGFGFSSDWELGDNYRLLMQNNIIYGNECMVPWWGNGGTNYSDGNGIIIDSNKAAYTGKTLIQNNVVFNNGGGGIHIFKAENIDVVHNTTYQNSASGVLAYPDSDTQSTGSTDGNWIKNVRYTNNISFARRNASGSSSLNETALGVAAFDRATIFHTRNVYGGGDSTPLLTGANFSDNTDLGRSYNPASLFLSPSIDGTVADFRLRSAASARNYGAVVNWRGVLDHAGAPRSLTGTTDAGAYQTVAGLAYSPISSPPSGKYTASQNVTLSSDTAAAKIVYTINGTMPAVDGAGNATNGVVYSVPIAITTSTTLKAIAWKAGLTTSPASTSAYDFQDLTAVPVSLQVYTKSGNGGVITAGGIFPGTTVIQPLTQTPGALMRYTTDGSDPTVSTGNAALYQGYSVIDYATLRYQAYKAGRGNSAIQSAEVTVRASTGNLADGSTLTGFGAGNIRFVRFHPAAKFSAAYVFARIAGVTGGYRAAIYGETAGAPSTRLAVSSLVTNPVTGWTAFPLTARTTLSSKDSNNVDLYYWLAIWSDNASAGIYATGTGGTVREQVIPFSSTWPNPAGTNSVVAGTENYAIYATNQPPNLAPVVNVGIDQSIANGGTSALGGTVTDDGVPLAPGTVTSVWSVSSGPGTVTFANPTSAATTATFSATGFYVLRLTARDALLSASDEITIGVGTGGGALDPSPPAGVVRARFADGAGSIWPQQYPGVTGDGWASAWTASAAASATVAATTPLTAGAGNYLSVARTGGSGSGLEGVYRQWSVAARPPDQFARLTFNLRLDSTTGVFNNATDNLTVTARSNAGATSGNESTFLIRTFGATNGPLATREWGVYNGDGVSSANNFNRFVPTGLVCHPGVTYTFTIDLFGATGPGTTGGKAHGTYDVTITDGTNTVTVPGSRYRSTAYSTGSYLSFSAGQNLTTDNIAFSVDSIEMNGLTLMEPLVSSANPADSGELVTFTANVVSGPVLTGAPLPSGTVTFLDGNTILGTDTLVGSSVATLSTSALTPGVHSITASFAATESWTGSTSPALSQTVRAATTTTLTSNTNPALLGGSATFTATVEGEAGVPAGSVTFFDGATLLGSGTLDASGVATLITSALSIGLHSLTAVYDGNASTSASPSSQLLQTVQRSDGTTRVLATNSGGVAIPGSGFGADADFAGGAITSTINPIDLSGATDPGPQGVYQTERYGTAFSYTLDGLIPSAAYQVRLHFSENWWGVAGRGGVANTVGRRLINVSINGAQRLVGFDVFAAAGAPNKAVVREFAAAADGSGQLHITFAAAVGSPDPNALIDGLEVYTVTPYDAWRASHFTLAQLDDTALSGITTDLDQDGLVHLLEYALDLDPKVPEAGPGVTVTLDPAGVASLSFLRARAGLLYQVEASSDLSAWTTIATNPGNVGEIVSVADTPPPNVAGRYLRLRVTQP